MNCLQLGLRSHIPEIVQGRYECRVPSDEVRRSDSQRARSYFKIPAFDFDVEYNIIIHISTDVLVYRCLSRGQAASFAILNDFSPPSTWHTR